MLMVSVTYVHGNQFRLVSSTLTSLLSYFLVSNGTGEDTGLSYSQFCNLF